MEKINSEVSVETENQDMKFDQGGREFERLSEANDCRDL